MPQILFLAVGSWRRAHGWRSRLATEFLVGVR
jgi:hypothetical protein